MELDILLRLLVAILVGAMIGLERQWHNCIAGLRTNILVSVGAALFVLLSVLTPTDNTPTRIASQIVSGIGFLGAGVIMKDGLTVRGLDTAATLWCSAAVGTLAGSGYLLIAITGTILIVSINSLLRPVSKWISEKSEKGFKYSQQVTSLSYRVKHKSSEKKDC
ncbi:MULTISPECIES: MgtC/SapB family protein [Bacillus cereus group]|uniref:MgtC/SapB family protein n=1 Tax=Bacillus cereus group TaxID=86661 RepID=UPI0011A5D029|nr:MgtC/SapB family protein [Bacillus mycoides]